MKAEVVSIGTELLLGEILDTNAQYLAARLPALGIDLYYVSQVGDNLERLTEVIERAWGRSDLVIATGGLGPTEDDLTREAIARALGEELTVPAELESRPRPGGGGGRGGPHPRRAPGPAGRDAAHVGGAGSAGAGAAIRRTADRSHRS